MPTISPAHSSAYRATTNASTEDSYRAPLKNLTVSTGMQLKEESKIGQPATSDNKVESPKEETAVSLSPQLTAMARKEAKFRQQEQQFKSEKAAFEASQSKYAKYASLEEKLSAKDYSILDELGVSYEEWTNYLLNKPDGEKPELQAIKKLEQEISGLKTSQEQNVSRQYEATLGQYRNDIKSLIETNADFSTVKELKQEDAVLQHILQTFNEDGEVLTVEQASKEIEDFLVEDAMKMAGLSKIKAKLQPIAEPKKLPPPKTGLRTLSQQIASGPSSSSIPSAQSQHLSMKERIAQAVLKSQRQ